MLLVELEERCVRRNTAPHPLWTKCLPHRRSGKAPLSLNVVDLAVLLHFAASPETHTVYDQGLPSRVDIHGMLAMLAPLTDVSIWSPTPVRLRLI